MTRSQNRPVCLPVLLILLNLMLAWGSTFAAGNALVSPDSNSRMVVENAVVNGKNTTVFFYTYPYLGDPNSGKPCPLNYYSVKLKPGLPSARADVVAKGVCGAGLFQKSRLLDNGDALIIVRDRLERWRAGEQINSQTFSSIDAVSKLGVTTDKTGGQFYDISTNGNVVLLIQSGGQGYDRGKYGGSSMIMSSLKPDGGRRWEARFSGDPTLTTINQVWAAPGGSALLHMSSPANGLATAVSQLHFISADGSRNSIELNETEEPLDMQKLGQMSQVEIQKIFAQQRNSKPESIKKLDAVARAGGGFDVLFHRKGGEQGREGYFLYRIGPDGTLLSKISLGNQIMEHGLERWFDFYISGNKLILMGKVFATQRGVRAKRKGWSQNVVSWIDLDTGTPVSRLIPLDRRYLEAAMNAGDAQMQHLKGLPGGEPALLTTLGKSPLVVSVGMISKHPALRLNEATDRLMAYTEAFDKSQADIAKKASRKQRKADRKARKRQMNADLASAVGMTPEEFAALSNKQRKAAMVRRGDTDAIMAAVMKQAEQVQRSMAASGMSPEQMAQMQAAMAQMQKMARGNVMSSAASARPATQAAPPTQPSSPAEVLKVDALMRGHVQFKNPDRKLTTMVVFNRQTGKELLKKEYPDGVINEYISLGRYKLPLEQIGIIIRNISGKILEDLTPGA